MDIYARITAIESQLEDLKRCIAERHSLRVVFQWYLERKFPRILFQCRESLDSNYFILLTALRDEDNYSENMLKAVNNKLLETYTFLEEPKDGYFVNYNTLRHRVPVEALRKYIQAHEAPL